jgi:hypothetical protein
METVERIVSTLRNWYLFEKMDLGTTEKGYRTVTIFCFWGLVLFPLFSVLRCFWFWSDFL